MHASIHLWYTPSLTRLVLFGEFDLGARDLLAGRLEDASAFDIPSVSVDARDVSFIDVGSLRLIDSARRRLEGTGCRFVVEGASAAFQRICLMVGYPRLLPSSTESLSPAMTPEVIGAVAATERESDLRG